MAASCITIVSICILLLIQVILSRDSPRKHVCQGDLSISCPAQCVCTDDVLGVVVDCTNRMIESVPEHLPADTFRFSMSGHNVTILPSRSFAGCDSLVELDLSRGYISSIDVDAFCDLGNLEILSLQENVLNASGDSIRTGTFDHLSRLRVLLLDDNNITGALNYKDELFQNVSSLEALSLDGLPTAKLGPGFSRLTNLQSFSVNGGIRHLTADILENLKNLTIQYLRVGGEQLRNLDGNSFSQFKSLQVLNLSYSYNLGFTNMSEAWYGLRYTNISELVLTRSVPYDWIIVTLGENFYEGLKQTNITKLHLDKNNIVTVEPRFSECLPNLEWLSIAYNRLQLVDDLVKDLAKLQKLKYFNGNYQFKRTVKRSVVDHIYKNSSNKLVALPRSFGTKNHSITILKRSQILSSSKDGNYQLKPFPWDTKIFLILPPHLEILLLSHSLSLKWDVFPMLVILGTTSVRYFDYSGNGLARWFGPIVVNVPPLPLVTLNLRDNGAYYMKPDFFGTFAYIVRRLLLRRNRLGNQLSRDTDGLLLKGLRNMKELELSDNEIKNLPEKFFSSLPQLESVDLSHNSIRLLQFNISYLSNLALLNLSSNIIISLDTRTMNDLEVISVQSGNRTITLDLSDNPFDCNCETFKFLLWVTSTPIVLSDWRGYSCTFNRTIVSFHLLENKILPILRVNCAGNAWLTATTTSFCFLVFIVAVSVILYRHRWDVKFFCIKLVRDRKRYQKIENEEEPYTWDAFVAFDHTDLLWVKNELLANLETERTNFKFCVHHRNFMPGVPIEENIVDNITKSRKVLLIVSEAFVRSGWCEFEMRMTSGRCFDEGKDLFVAIILENVPASSMSRSLQTIIKKNTYIEWPNSVNEQSDFWDNLREALVADPVRQLMCQCGRQVVTQ